LVQFTEAGERSSGRTVKPVSRIARRELRTVCRLLPSDGELNLVLHGVLVCHDLHYSLGLDGDIVTSASSNGVVDACSDIHSAAHSVDAGCFVYGAAGGHSRSLPFVTFGT